MKRPLPLSLALAGLVAACAGSLESAVHDAREAHRYPTGMSIVYDDRTPLLGGDRIEIDPDGAVRRWQDVPAAIDAGDAPEDTFDDARQLPPTPERAPDITATASAESLSRLLAIVETIAPWGRRPVDVEDDGRLERRRALLRVQRNGDTAFAWQWADPTESGDARITAIRRWADLEIQRPVPDTTTGLPEDPDQVDAGPNPVLRNR